VAIIELWALIGFDRSRRAEPERVAQSDRPNDTGHRGWCTAVPTDSSAQVAHDGSSRSWTLAIARPARRYWDPSRSYGISGESST